MGKILDLLLSDSWEEYQRIQLYKKVGRKFDIEADKIEKEIEED